MAAKKIETSGLLGRKVRLGWSTEQMNAWASENPGKSLNSKLIPAQYAQCGRQEGIIRAVRSEENRLVCTIECGPVLMDLCPDFNFDLIDEPPQLPKLPPNPPLPTKREYQLVSTASHSERGYLEYGEIDEDRLNEYAFVGWRVVSVQWEAGKIVAALLEK